MNATWFISVAGVKRPLAQWGITNAKLKLVSLARDTLSFEQSAADINAAPTFSFDALVELYQGTTRRFSGRIIQTPAALASTADRQKYVAAGAWADLESVTYQAARKVPIDPTDDSSALETIFTSDVMLFQDAALNRMSGPNQIHAAIDFAISHGSNAAPGVIDGDIVPPFESGLDLLCSEVVRRAARWTQDASSYFDYAFYPPSFNLRRRPFASSTTLDLNSKDTIVEVQDVTPRYDIQPTGLKIYAQRVKKRADGSYWQYYDSFSEGISGGLRELVYTIPATGEDLSADIDLSLLASQFWTAVSPLHYSGVVGIYDPTGTIFVHPGTTINLENGKADWATMQALVQQVEVDLDRDIQRVTFGPADHLELQDFLSLAKHARNSPPGKDGKDGKDGRDTGTWGGGNLQIPSYSEVSICKDGSDSTLNVRTN